MATANPFDLLGDNDNDDPSQLIAKATAAAPSGGKKPAATAAAKLPTKPLPPTQAVREARNEASSGRGRGGHGNGRGGGRGGGQFRDLSSNEGSYNNGFTGGSNLGEDGEVGRPSERGRGGYGGPRPPYRGGRRGGYGNGETGDSQRPRRQFERRSGTGRGTELKRDGAGRGNWGTPTDETFIQASEELATTEEKSMTPGKQPEIEDVPADGNKEEASIEAEEKEPEDKKEMTLEEYEKILEEKRKALLAMKTEERKVVPDKELESMQQLSVKKVNDDIFIKLSEKDLNKRKESSEKEERMKKAVSINEFLKPAEGERYYNGGRGRGDRGGFRGGYAGGSRNSSAAPSIEDPGQFPTLGGK